MPDKEPEVYSNPLPPSLQEEEFSDDEDARNKLTNEDFRKLMMTPRPPSGHAPVTPAPPQATARVVIEKKPEEDEDDPALKRKKKKSYYAKLKKMEEEREKELAQKYRDRARERRDGVNTDYEQTDIVSTTADYRAVAPDAKSGENIAERRKQVIQESKYLGGDMEHTHLVKGLDYALLEKVRAEITNKEDEEELDMESAVQDKPDKEEDPEAQMVFKTRLGRHVFRMLFKHRPAERNELFLPGRMAYVVDLEDEMAESDVPTTLIRSKADCPNVEATTTLTTNDIVINKLTQILSYLRQGRRDRKLKKKEKGKLKDDDKAKLAEDGIYGDLTDYMPSVSKVKDSKERDRKERDRGHERERDRQGGERDRRDRDRHDRDRRDRDRGRDRGDRDQDRERGEGEEKKRSYFEKPTEEEDEEPTVDKVPGSAAELVKTINDRFAPKQGWGGTEPDQKKPTREEDRLKRISKRTLIDSYAECYPGMAESADAIDDSDDEVDYTKMDQGNKKGPVGRWDFETQEEYSDYMANKEALPKAAFQYGVKMADGRKTRRTGPKDEKKELDREWQKIQNLIQKRKQMGTDGAPFPKAAKY